jgi:hypothetical protein
MLSHTPHPLDGSFDRRVAHERRGRRLWWTAPARLALGSLLGAVLVALAPIPFGHAGAAGLALLLALPAVLAAVVLGEGARLLLSPRAALRTLRAALSGAAAQAQIIVAGAVLLVGFYASNVFLVDIPLGRLTTVAYLGTTVLALLAALVTRWLTGRPAVRERLAHIPRWGASAATIALFGCAGVFADAVVLPGGVARLHRICLVLVILSFAAVGSLCARRLPLRRVAALVAAAVAFMGLASLASDRSATRLAVEAPPTLHTLLLEEARRILDRDGDGFSALLDGGDCDDSDPRAYPLSRTGRDCLGWMPSGDRRPPPPAPLVAPVVSSGPAIVVMVTIDAFRCGFGQAGTGPFRDICPRLTEMAVSGRARLDAHCEETTTISSMDAVHLGGQVPHGPPLATLLAQAGYRTHAILTHRNLMHSPAIPASFDSVDTSLVTKAADLTASTAAATTDRALEWLRAEEHARGKLFVWAHYYDPHDPYVRDPGSPLVFDRPSSYFAEVRRTDAEIGRLADELARLARAPEVMLLVFADHGEAFGEHGRDHHFTSIHEESARIPFVAWSPAGEPGRFLTAPLPTSVLDVRAFLMALLGGPPYQPSSEVLVETRYAEDTQVGVVAGGWKLIHHQRLNYDELYDLGADPAEQDDRAARSPDKLAEMGRRLGLRLLDPAAH